MTVPTGLTNDRSTAGLEAADLSWGGTGDVPIDPVAATLLNAKLSNGQYMIPSAQSSACPMNLAYRMCSQLEPPG